MRDFHRRLVHLAALSAVFMVPGTLYARHSKKHPPAVKLTPSITPPVKPTNARIPTVDNPAQMEGATFRRLNEIRQQRGLNTLQLNAKLSKVAREYSRRMAEGHFFEHVSPSGDSMVERVKAAGLSYSVLGENLFMCENDSDPVVSATQGWMRSTGHRENILQPEFTETGVGVWKRGNTYYFTQLFLRPPLYPDPY